MEIVCLILVIVLSIDQILKHEEALYLYPEMKDIPKNNWKISLKSMINNEEDTLCTTIL